MSRLTFRRATILGATGPTTGREVAEIAPRLLGHRVALRSAGPFVLRLVSLFNAPPR